MRVAIPHTLDPAEVRHRLRTKSHKMADMMPGGQAQVDTDWPTEDRMNMRVRAMGQEVSGHIEIEPEQLIFDISLPAALSFVEPMIAGAIAKQGQKLLN